MEAVSSTGDARLILIGAIVTALITAGGPIILALINRGRQDPPPPDLDLVDDLDHINDRLGRENEAKGREIDRLTRACERKDAEIERLQNALGAARTSYAQDRMERRPPDAEPPPRL